MKTNKIGIKIIIAMTIFFMDSYFTINGFGNEIELSKIEFNLTQEERAWVKSNKSIIIGGPRAFPPFHYFDDQGNLKGISADYIFTIMNQLGIKLEIASDLPWPEVLDRAKSGKIDLIPCIAKVTDRERYLSFSNPYLSFPLVILTRKDAPFIGGINDLHGKKLAIIQKNATLNWLNRDKIKFKQYYVESPLKRIEAISFGKVDAGIENLAAASYLIQQHGLTNVKIAAPTPYGAYDLHMAVRKDLPELLGIINKVIEGITPEQHMQIRSKWLSVRYEHGVSKIDILKWVLLIVLIAAIIVTVILLWNRKLKKESLVRLKLIGELEDALAEIKTLKGIVPICSNCKKIRDDKGYWNLLETFIENHSEASFSHGMCPECSDTLYGKENWYKDMKTDQEKE
ncbi:MAG: transporter substrate-binding domain-containing protein [Desulfobacteraceae bacterium]|nr:transporter substrate-binding domain-containing protein [Desulfobacteraceae bacterium]